MADRSDDPQSSSLADRLKDAGTMGSDVAKSHLPPAPRMSPPPAYAPPAPTPIGRTSRPGRAIWALLALLLLLAVVVALVVLT